uniref:Putative salivary kunitz domain protein n=1 Tax=Ixodes ricinus TaxID=34613 RepID=A0A147BI03_IXORI
MVQKMMQFIFVVCFVILACRALSYEELPDECFPPDEDPRCRAYGKRYFYNTSINGCHGLYGCWDDDYGYLDKRKCNSVCKVD